MRDALSNLLRLQPQNLIPEVYVLAGVLWLIVVICAFFSVASQKIGKLWKVVWIISIVAVPLAGLLVYCVFCLTRLEFAWFPSLGTGWLAPEKGAGVHLSGLHADRSSPSPMAGRTGTRKLRSPTRTKAIDSDLSEPELPVSEREVV